MTTSTISGTCDTLRLNIQDMEKWMKNVRRLIRIKADPKQSARAYVELLRIVAELQDIAKELGATGPLVAPLDPIPFQTQIFGRSPEETKRLAWTQF